MTPDALTLPADVPGLDLTGLRVLDREGHGYIVVAEAGGCAYLGASGVAPAPLDRLRLSLRDDATQDRLLRWLAGRHPKTIEVPPVGPPVVRYFDFGDDDRALIVGGHQFASTEHRGRVCGSHVPPLVMLPDTSGDLAIDQARIALEALAVVVAWEVSRG